MSVSENTFLRELAVSHEHKLSSTLDINGAWEIVAARIPTNANLLFHPEEDWTPKYNTTKIHTFKCMRGSPTRNLLTNWGTRNVALKHLLQVLRLTNLHHAANVVERDILRKPEQQFTTNCSLNRPGEDRRTPSTSISSPDNHNDMSQPAVTRDSGYETYAPMDGEGCQISSIYSELSNKLSDISESDVVEHQNLNSDVVEHQNLNCLRVDRNKGSLSTAWRQRLGQQEKPLSAWAVPEALTPPVSDVTAQVDRRWAFVGEQEKTSQGEEVSYRFGEMSNPERPSVTPTPEDQTLSDSVRDLQNVPFDVLKTITNNFDAREEWQGGRLLGEGGFGEVFLGITSNRTKVAIKCMKDTTAETEKQFLVEIKTLSLYRHKNLVRLLGYSLDGNRRCLVYEYMVNGSLEDQLACKNSSRPLSTEERLNIIKGTATGIEFLHQGNLAHRDIKSANILLDEDFTPKVGDFATARGTASTLTTKILLTSKIIGTQVYLAPEALAGQIHIGLDCYSFGVVLLEVLTGLPVLDLNRKEHDLKTFVFEHCEPDDDDDDDDDAEVQEPGTIFDLLDPKAGEWSEHWVELLFTISKKCLEISAKRRAKMRQVVKWLDLGKIVK